MTRIYDTYRRNHDRLRAWKLLVKAVAVIAAGFVYGAIAGGHTWW